MLAITQPWLRPPEEMRPDRSEVMNPVGNGRPSQIGPGVSFECLVGAHNQAQSLTTGQVTFAAEAALPYHTHPFTEAITLLEGQAWVEVAGRRYELEPFDNVVIPRQLPHAAGNPDAQKPALLHIAMATASPSRSLVDEVFSSQVQPLSSQGHPGAERVNRFRLAPRSSAGPNTQFIDFFNVDLVPGLEMSGGYGLFHREGRLPAHVHDFDESIAIVAGTATCIVEGRSYALSGGGTALVPRGRVHYFRNQEDSPMAMIWVYAGPRPERLIVAESCATEDGNPWK